MKLLDQIPFCAPSLQREVCAQTQSAFYFFLFEKFLALCLPTAPKRIPFEMRKRSCRLKLYEDTLAGAQGNGMRLRRTKAHCSGTQTAKFSAHN